MAFTDTYNESYPAGSTPGNELDTAITQGVKRAFRERLAVDHNFFQSETGESNVGCHKKCTLLVQASDPAAVASAGILYTKDVSAKAELFWEDEDGNVLQLTSAGASAAVPAGIIVMWHGTIANIPSGWIICDGNNSTPNLLNKFVRGVATAATNPGTTGGADTHTHDAGSLAGPSHTHTYSGTTSTKNNDGSGEGPAQPVTAAHSHTYSGTTDAGGTGAVTGATASGSTLPAYYAVAFLMKS